jgi:hypothetical protein
MTDESHGIDPIEEPTPPPGMPEVAHDDQAVLEGAGDFTSGEGLVAFAGIVIVAVWLIFDIIATEYFLGHVILLLGAVAAVVPRLDRVKVERVHPVAVIMKTVGYGVAVMGLVALVEDVRFEAYDEVWAVLGAVITYGAAVMAFVGARQIET